MPSVRSLLVFLFALVLGSPVGAADWSRYFQHQPVSARPRLEVRYTDQSRRAFEILAESYHVKGPFVVARLEQSTRPSRCLLHAQRIIRLSAVLVSQSHEDSPAGEMDLFRERQYPVVKEGNYDQ